MQQPSSTSGSERFRKLPLAGVLAALLLLACDSFVFRLSDPWPRFADLGVDGWPGVTLQTQLERAKLDQPAQGLRAVVFGNSRMQQAYRPELTTAEMLGGFEVVRIAEPRVFLVEIRTVASELNRPGPDVVVLGLSASDIHRPPKLDPHTALRGLQAFVDVAAEMGIGYAFEQRSVFFQTAIGDGIAGYRYRGILGALGLKRLRRFARHEREPREDRPSEFEADIIAAIRPENLEGEAPKIRLRWLRQQISMLMDARSGPHVAAQLKLLRNAIIDFGGIGSQVVIFELPLHPAGAQLYDSSLRADFLAQVEVLVRDHGAYFVPVESQPVIDPSEFSDLVHVTERGAEKLTRAILEAVHAAHGEKSK